MFDVQLLVVLHIMSCKRHQFKNMFDMHDCNEVPYSCNYIHAHIKLHLSYCNDGV